MDLISNWLLEVISIFAAVNLLLFPQLKRDQTLILVFDLPLGCLRLYINCWSFCKHPSYLIHVSQRKLELLYSAQPCRDPCFRNQSLPCKFVLSRTKLCVSPHWKYTKSCHTESHCALRENWKLWDVSGKCDRWMEKVTNHSACYWAAEAALVLPWKYFGFVARNSR